MHPHQTNDTVFRMKTGVLGRWQWVAAGMLAAGVLSGCEEERRGLERTPSVSSSPPPSSSSSSSSACTPSGVGDWEAQPADENIHVVDGQFGREEWASAVPLEGVLTDVYMHVQNGRLYFLNDWRRNTEGIRPDCNNYFRFSLPSGRIDLRVFGDGRVEVTRGGELIEVGAEGAYGFGPSPAYPLSHTIYEFSLPLEDEELDICCFDPVSLSTCEDHEREPMVVSVQRSGGSGTVRVRRQIPPDVTRLGDGDSCGEGQGICEDGFRCIGRACVRSTPRDAGAPDADAGDTGRTPS